MNPLSRFWTQAKERKLGFGWAITCWIALSVAVAVSIWLYAYRLSTQMSMETWASYAGHLQAKVWFREGRYRLLELSSGEKSQFTGRTDGPFEIWTWPHYTNAPLLTVETTDHEFVRALNSRMRHLWDTRQKGGQPDIPANRSQPASSETNRTSSAVGSRR